MHAESDTFCESHRGMAGRECVVTTSGYEEIADALHFPICGVTQMQWELFGSAGHLHVRAFEAESLYRSMFDINQQELLLVALNCDIAYRADIAHIVFVDEHVRFIWRPFLGHQGALVGAERRFHWFCQAHHL